MIISYKDKATEDFARGKLVRNFESIDRIAKRKLLQLEIAGCLNDLRIPPGNKLEKLSGKREGQYSIRINDQFRICFEWTQAGAKNVEIVDYHN